MRRDRQKHWKRTPLVSSSTICARRGWQCNAAWGTLPRGIHDGAPATHPGLVGTPGRSTEALRPHPIASRNGFSQRLPTRDRHPLWANECCTCGAQRRAWAAPVAPAPVGRCPQGRRTARVASRTALQCERAREQGEVGGEWRCGLGGCTGCRELARCITRNALRM